MKRTRAAAGTPTSRNLIVRHAYVEERPCNGGQNAPLASTPANCSGRELLPPPSELGAGLPAECTAVSGRSATPSLLLRRPSAQAYAGSPASAGENWNA